MPYQIDDQVLHASHGVGRIVGVVTRRFTQAEARYYEIALPRSTVWVPVDGRAADELRLLTPRAELTHYRGVLRSRPSALTQDHRQRRLDLASRLKEGTFQVRCEVVRDLSARAWHKALGDIDAAALRKTRDEVCQEWAAVDGVSISEAMQEVDALLQEGRRTFQA